MCHRQNEVGIFSAAGEVQVLTDNELDFAKRLDTFCLSNLSLQTRPFFEVEHLELISFFGPALSVYLPLSTASHSSFMLMRTLAIGLATAGRVAPLAPVVMRFGPVLPACEWRVRPMPPPLTPIQPIIEPIAKNACPIVWALLMRADASPSMNATGFVVASSRANERILFGGVPQISDAHSGVLAG